MWTIISFFPNSTTWLIFLHSFSLSSCGQVQTGSFLDIAAPNGLFGLGLDKISVPSTLSREGYIANSFSMCFGQDGTGRINFGDNGTLDQEETPFHMNSFQWVHVISDFTLYFVDSLYFQQAST